VQKTSTPVVLVLLNGGPVSTPFAAENVSAIVEAWYGGSEGGNALSNVMFGRVSPAGIVPYTTHTLYTVLTGGMLRQAASPSPS
jgi:beta-glucosidase